jgi:hypothetical protein
VSLVEAGETAWPAAETYVHPSACSTDDASSSCRYSKELWPKDYSEAIAGGYQGQRNVSFCLSTGCQGAIVVNKILGCAWRFVILESGHLSADSSDVTNAKYYCGVENVDSAELAAAEAQAKTLLRLLASN